MTTGKNNQDNDNQDKDGRLDDPKPAVRPGEVTVEQADDVAWVRGGDDANAEAVQISREEHERKKAGLETAISTNSKTGLGRMTPGSRLLPSVEDSKEPSAVPGDAQKVSPKSPVELRSSGERPSSIVVQQMVGLIEHHREFLDDRRKKATGKETENQADLTEPSSFPDAALAPSRVKTALGEVRSFERQLRNDGSSFVKKASESNGIEWNAVDQDGKVYLRTGSTDVIEGTLHVRINGDYYFDTPQETRIERLASNNTVVVSDLKIADSSQRKQLIVSDDRSAIVFSKGHVESTVNARGKLIQYGDHNDEGQPRRIKQEGVEWTTKDNVVWTDGDGNTRRQTVYLDLKNGDLSTTSLDHSGKATKEIVLRQDGSETVKDSHHRGVSVSDRFGAKTTFHYEDEKSINPSMVEKYLLDGTTLKLSAVDGTTWRNESTGKTQQLEITVKGNGSFTEKAGVTVKTFLTDGWTEVSEGCLVHFERRNPDGSLVSKNAAGEVSAISDRYGVTRYFDRDEFGTITGITEPNGEKLTRSAGTDDWISSDQAKAPRTFVPDANVSGIYRELSDQGARVFKADGSEVKQNKLGLISEVIDAERVNGHTVEKSTRDLQKALIRSKAHVPAILETLSGKTDAQRRAIAADFEEKVGNTLEKVLKTKLYGGDLDRAMLELNRRGISGDRRRTSYTHDQFGVSTVTARLNQHEEKYTRTKPAGNGEPARWTGPKDVPFSGTFRILEDGGREQVDADSGTTTVHHTDGRLTIKRGDEPVVSESSDGTRRERRAVADPDNTSKNILQTEVRTPDGAKRTYLEGRGLVEIRNRDGTKITLENSKVLGLADAKGKDIARLKYGSDGEVSDYKDPQGKWHKLGANDRISVVAKKDDYKVTAEITIKNELTGKQIKIGADGSTEVREESGILKYSREWHLTGSANAATGVGYEFGWKDNRVVSTERFEHGKSQGVWLRGPADQWLCGKQEWHGKVKLNEATGVYSEQQYGQTGDDLYFRPTREEAVVKFNQIAKAADDIHYACNGNIAIGTNEANIKRILSSLPHLEQRQRLESLYLIRYKHSLQEQFQNEMGNSHHYIECMAKLKAPNLKSDYAGEILQALQEKTEFEGRSPAECETVIRRILASRTSKEIEQLKHDFEQRQCDVPTPGPVRSLQDALIESTKLTSGSREAIEIYLKGADKRSTKDALELADIGLRSQNLQIFQEAWMGSTESAQEKFLAEVRDDKTGEERITAAFGANVLNFWSSTNSIRAHDYHQHGGEVSMGTVIRENNRSWLGANETAIENGLRDLSDAQRSMYVRGREIERDGIAPLTVSQQAQFNRGQDLVLKDKLSTDPSLNADEKAAIKLYQKRHHDQRSSEFYHDTFEAMSSATGHFSFNSAVAEHGRWHDMAMRKSESLLAQLGGLHCDVLYLSTQSVMSTIENMSSTDHQRLKKSPEYRDEIRTMLRTITAGSESDPTSELSRAFALVEKMKNTEADTSRGRQLIGSGFDPEQLGERDRKSLQTYEGYGANADKARMTPDQKYEYEAGKKVADDIAAFKFYRQYQQGKEAFDRGLDPGNISSAQMTSLQSFQHFGPQADISKLPSQNVYEKGKTLREDLAALEFYKKESYKASQSKGRRDVLSVIDDNVRVHNNNEDNIYDALTRMTPTEVFKYKHNINSFRNQLDAKIENVLDSTKQSTAERTIARGLLAQAADGKQPKFDILDKLNRHSSFFTADRGQIARDIEQAFREDPALQIRIAKPRTASELKSLYDSAMLLPQGLQQQLSNAQSDGSFDRRIGELAAIWKMPVDQLKQSFLAAQKLPGNYISEISEVERFDGLLHDKLESLSKQEFDFSGQFKSAARGAFGIASYERFGDDLIHHGKLELAERLQLNEGIFDDNEQGFFEDVSRLSPAMREQMLGDEGLRASAFRNLSASERTIAGYILEQGTIKAEDKLRSYMVGAGTNEAQMLEVFAKIKDRDRAREEIMNRDGVVHVSDEMVSDEINSRLQTIRNDYLTKYGETLDVRMKSELSGNSLRDIELAAAREGRNPTEVLNDALRHYWASQSFGAWLTDAAGWDGTTEQTNSMFARAIAVQVEAAMDGKELTMDDALKIKAAMETAVGTSIDSQNQLVDAMVDTVITVAAILVSLPSGGASAVAGIAHVLSKLPLAAKVVTYSVRAGQTIAAIPGVTQALHAGSKASQYGKAAYTAVSESQLVSGAAKLAAKHPNVTGAIAGGLFKPAVKARTVAGHESPGDYLNSTLSGAGSGGFNADIAIGPFARRAAQRAAVKITGDLLEDGGKRLVSAAGNEVIEESLKQGGGNLFEAEANKTVKDQLASLVDDAVKHQSVDKAQTALRGVAEAMVNRNIQGEARDLLVDVVEQNIGDAFEKAVREELEDKVRQFANTLVWNVKQGGLAGTASAAVMIDPDASIEQNLSAVATGGLAGSATAGAFTTAINGSVAIGSHVVKQADLARAQAPETGNAAAVGPTISRSADHRGPTRDGALIGETYIEGSGGNDILTDTAAENGIVGQAVMAFQISTEHGVKSIPAAIEDFLPGQAHEFHTHKIEEGALPDLTPESTVFLSSPAKDNPDQEVFKSVRTQKVLENSTLPDGRNVEKGDYVVTDNNGQKFMVKRQAFDDAFLPKPVHKSVMESRALFREAVENGDVITTKKQLYEVRVTRVTGDKPIKVETLECPDGEIAYPGQFIVQRLDKFGFPVIERGMVNQWPVSEAKKIAKTYNIDLATLNALDSEHPSTVAKTRTDGPLVNMIQIKAEGGIKIKTPWGEMSGAKGDWLANYDFEAGKPGSDFSLVDADAFSRNYSTDAPEPIFEPVGRPGADFAIVTNKSFKQTYESANEESSVVLARLRGEKPAEVAQVEQRPALNSLVSDVDGVQIFGPAEVARRNGEITVEKGAVVAARFLGNEGSGAVAVRYSHDVNGRVESASFEADGKKILLKHADGKWIASIAGGSSVEAGIKSLEVDNVEPWLGSLTIVKDDGSTIRHNPFLDRLDISSDDPVDLFKSGLVPRSLDLTTPPVEFIKTATVRARIISDSMTVNGEYRWKNPDAANDADDMISHAGDWIIHPPDGSEPYVARGMNKDGLSAFEDNYAEMAGFPGQYAKRAVSMAVRLEKPSVVQHPQQGVTAGLAGDYLVVEPNGNQYIVPKTKWEAQYAPRAMNSGVISQPMSLPETTGKRILLSDTPEGGRVYEDEWKDGTIVSEEKSGKITVKNDTTGETKIFKHGILVEESKVIDSATGKKFVHRRYPYEQIDKVSQLVDPKQLNEQLLKTRFGKDGPTVSLKDVRDRAFSIPDTMSNQTLERTMLQHDVTETHWDYLLHHQSLDPEYAKLNLGEPKQEKHARILMGLTGSGKTSSGMGDLNGKGYMVIESDDIKKRLPEYEGGIGATALRRESNMLNDRMLERAITGGYNFVLPGVGTDAKWMKETISNLSEAGWKIDLVFVDIPPSEAMNRVVNRFSDEGRFVDPGYLVTQGHVPAQTYRNVVDAMFYNGEGLSGFRHVWNLDRPPLILEEGSIEPR